MKYFLEIQLLRPQYDRNCLYLPIANPQQAGKFEAFTFAIEVVVLFAPFWLRELKFLLDSIVREAVFP